MTIAMKNIIYAFDMLLRRPFLLLIIIIQFTGTFLFLNLSLTGVLTARETTKRINNIFEDRNYYAIQDRTNEELLEKIFMQPDVLDKMNQFYGFLKDNHEFDFIEYYDGHIAFKAAPVDDQRFYYYSEPIFSNAEQERLFLLNQVTVGPKFFQLLPFEIAKGNLFGHADFNNNDATVASVILGHAYQDYYDLGDKIEFYDYDAQTVKRLQVKGFLKKDAYFISRGAGLINLDYYMVLPFKTVDITDEYALANLGQIISQSLIISGNVKETFISISAESNRLKLYTSLNPYDLNQHSLIISDAINAGLRSLLPIGIAVLLFASISMVVSLLSFLRKNTKEIGVHLLAGATMKNIALRILWISMICLSFSFVLATLISNQVKNNIFPDFYQGQVLYYTVPLMLLIVVLISVWPVVKFLRTEISEIIRRKE